MAPLCIGYHVSKSMAPSKPMETNIALYRDRIRDTKCVQIFIAGPREYKLRFNDEQAAAFAEYVKDNEIFVVAHATYLDHPWAAKTTWFIKQELKLCEKMGISFLLHLGNQDVDVVDDVLTHMRSEDKKVGLRHPVRIYLETPAMMPAKSRYANVDNLVALMKVVGEKHNVGICVDTAHIYSCGVDISGYEKAREYFTTLIDGIGADRLMIHLNDNANKLGYGKDRHERLTDGDIWRKYKDNMKASGLWSIFKLVYRYNIKTILELDLREDLLYDFQIIELFDGDRQE